MNDKFWWDTNKDDGCVNAILKLSVEARMWYLKTDVKVRLKHFILHNVDLRRSSTFGNAYRSLKKISGKKPEV
jgi:hypothetical protein